MDGILAPLEAEKTNEEKRIINRYGMLTPPRNARYVGVPIAVSFIVVRTVDRLRMEHAGNLPVWFLDLIAGDPIADKDLRNCYSPDHPIHKLDVTGFSNVMADDVADEQAFQSSLLALILRNFRCKRCYVRSDEFIFGPIEELSARLVKKGIKKAFDSRIAYKNRPQSETVLPGWSEKTHKNWEEIYSPLEKAHLETGGQDPCFYSVTPATSVELLENCVKGGRRA